MVENSGRSKAEIAAQLNILAAARLKTPTGEQVPVKVAQGARTAPTKGK